MAVHMEHISTIRLSPLPFLDRIRSLAMIMVIGVHSFGYAPQYTGISYEITRFLINTVPVSIFFLVDGYLFSHKVKINSHFSYTRYLKKSFNRLFIPWLAFSILYASLRYFFERIDFFDKYLLVDASLSEQFIAIYASAIAPQTYFLLSLLIIRLFTPLFHYLVHSPAYKTLILALLYYLFFFLTFPLILEHNPIKQGQEPVIHAIWGAHFYLTGMLIFRLKKLRSKTTLMLLLITFPISLSLRYSMQSVGYIYLLQYHYLLLLFLLFYYYSAHFHFLDIFKKYTMGIYLIHAPVVLKLTAILTLSIHTYPATRFFSIWVLSLLIAWLITHLTLKIKIGCWVLGQLIYPKKPSDYQKQGELGSAT